MQGAGHRPGQRLPEVAATATGLGARGEGTPAGQGLAVPPPSAPCAPAARAGAGPSPDALPQSCGRQRAGRAGGGRAGGAKSSQGEDPPPPLLPEPARGVPGPARLSFPRWQPEAVKFTAPAREMIGPTGSSRALSPPGSGARGAGAATGWAGSWPDPVSTALRCQTRGLTSDLCVFAVCSGSK